MILLGHFPSFILVIEWVFITHSLLLQYVLVGMEIKLWLLKSVTSRHSLPDTKVRGKVKLGLWFVFGCSTACLDTPSNGALVDI